MNLISRKIVTVKSFTASTLEKSDKDVILAPYLWDSDLYKFEIIGPMFLRNVDWYIKYPKTYLRSDYYLQPFQRNLWFIILFHLLFGTGLIILESIVNKKFGIGLIFTAFEIFCNQSNEGRDYTSLKIILLMMNIIGFVIVNAFGAVITAFLSVEIMKTPFSDLEGFVKNGQYISSFWKKKETHYVICQ